MYGNDDTMHRFKPGLRGDDKRHPYKGNKNPSPHEYAREGYATFAMADASANYQNSIENRDTISDDAEEWGDPLVRSPW
jgi:hypothetical protein